jgi:hypothetical protein
MDEVWGVSAHLDKLADYFKDLMLAHHLIDLAPVAPTPTWRNDMGGLDLISKRLDHVLISEYILREIGRHRAWVELPFVSDHAPVVVQFDIQPFPLAFPFKLKLTWLIEDEFESIVKEIWNDHVLSGKSYVQYMFMWKLKTLKSRIKSWAKQKRAVQQRRLITMEGEIRDFIAALPRSGTSDNRLKTLETE